MKQTKKTSLLVSLGILAVLVLVFLRLGLFFIKSDGFSGLSMLLPVLLIGFILSALCTSALFAAWVYQDCKKRGGDPVLWAVIVFAVTPFIGLLVYFLSRSEIRTACPACGHRISVRAKYCEECGTHIEKEEQSIMVKKETNNVNLVIANIVCMVLMLVCIVGFIIHVAAGKGFNTDVASNEQVWNLGMISMDHSAFKDNVWDFGFKSASEGFVKEQRMTIADADAQLLYADISCGTVPDGATLVLWLVQGDVVKTIDVTNLSETLEYPLNEFENGKIRVRLQINGVKDTVSEIEIR